MSMTTEEYLKLYGTPINQVNALVGAGLTQDAITYADAEHRRMIEAAEAQKKAANETAAMTYGNAISAADNAYKRDQVTYGMAAERMAQAGLANTGYGDNLTRDALATRAMTYADAARYKGEADKAAAQEYAGALSYADAERAKADTSIKVGEKALEQAAQATAKAYEDYSAYTLADIDNDTTITAEQKAAIKAQRDGAIRADIDSAIKYGDAAQILSAMQGLDTLYGRGGVDKATYDEIKAKYESDPTVLSAMYQAGLIGEDAYIKGITKGAHEGGTPVTDLGNGKVVEGTPSIKAHATSSANPTFLGWATKGLGGSTGDAFQITVGQNTFDPANAFSATLGKTIKEAGTVAELNAIATGDPSTAPDDKTGFTRFFGAGDGTGDTNNGRIVVMNGKVYAYNRETWHEVNSPGLAAAILSSKTYR